MGYIHEVDGEVFGLEEREDSFVILFGGDREEHDVYVDALPGISGGIELSFERIAELRRLLAHPALSRKLHEELSELANTLPLQYAPEELDALLLKSAEIFRKYGDDSMADLYEKIAKKKRREKDDSNN